MLILVTGPTCSGKTSFARAWAKGPPVHLDLYDRVEGFLVDLERLRQAADDVLLIEGMLSGHADATANLIEQCDCVIVLQAPLFARLSRAVLRDKAAGLIRFLKNEIAWRRYCAPQLQPGRTSAQVRYLTWQPDNR